MRITLLLSTALALAAHALDAQAAPRADTTKQSAEGLRAYLDCQTMGCDRDFFVTEIAFVNWTRDRADADIHVLVTALETGSGGMQYTLQFIGQRQFASHADTLVIGVTPDATSDDRRGAVRLRQGVRPLEPVDVQGQRERVLQRGEPDELLEPLRQPQRDAHHRAVEDQRGRERQLSPVELHVTDTTTPSVFIQRSSGVNVRVVRSLTDHWSVGVNANVGHAEFNNQDLTAGGRASLEYNFFKWKEATQHQFILANTTTER